MKTKVYLADLTHTAQGIAALSFPLGTAYVASYANQRLGNEFEFHLFKFPEELAERIAQDPPRVLALSNYSWNLTLGYELSRWAKNRHPDLVVILGGPNFPFVASEKADFLRKHSAVDFYIENEGEFGFVDLMEKLDASGFDPEAVKARRQEIQNCCYLHGDELVQGPIERILDVNEIPSPYLSGLMDRFFDSPLAPMLETMRGCPFSCTFCTDGLPTKNRVVRFDAERVQQELHYIAEHIKDVDELIITDLNFGMYKEDLRTVEVIADLQRTRGWPILVKASAGKNKPERIIEAVSMLKGSWVIGSAIQSSDPEVLKNIKRDNISTEAYRKFIDHANSRSQDAQSYTEVILALPGDTKEKHFQSLRIGIDSDVNTFRMYQAMLLMGTEMASRETREKFRLLTRFRVLPGCAGNYQFSDETIPVAEIEEIIVGSKDMPFEDYVVCRMMNLFIETYINNDLFQEFFAPFRLWKISVFDFLLYLLENEDLYTPGIRRILDSFLEATMKDLYESREDAEAHVSEAEVVQKYISGELGGNELLDHRALLYFELEDTSKVLIAGMKRFLGERGIWNESAAEYFAELRQFVLLKKRNVHEPDQEFEKGFSYDFKRLESFHYRIDPRYFEKTPGGIELRFFHDEPQRNHIRNAVGLYSNHPDGMARMIQRSNLKKMYRRVEWCSA